MYPIGSNAINEATIGETAQGLASYLRQLDVPGQAPENAPSHLSCAIGYDTRHRSRDFAVLCAEVMVANGIHTYFLDGYRSTPALAAAVRLNRCRCGIMVSASHNPPSDNALKIFWGNGGQIQPPHDQGVLVCAANVQSIARVRFQTAVRASTIEYCQDAVDEFYQSEVLKLGYPDNRATDLRILFSPMHGVASTSILPVLKAAGFYTELYARHAEPSGDFPNVPNHVANPENAEIFAPIIRTANKSEFDLILASDPDADRIGCAARLTNKSEFATLNGNQIGVLICEYLLSEMRRHGSITDDCFVVKTLVTTDMLQRIATAFGVRCLGDVPTGFKWIGKVIDEHGPENFVLAVEEAHGYLAGTHIRDKDGAAAAILLAEAAVRARRENCTLHQWLDRCFTEYGCHMEKTQTRTHPGADGMCQMNATMDGLRTHPPQTLAGFSVTRIEDYLSHKETVDGDIRKLKNNAGPPSTEGVSSNLVILRTSEEGNYVAVRPSGTEPKIKFYFFTYAAPQTIRSLRDTKLRLNERIDKMAADLFASIGQHAHATDQSS